MKVATQYDPFERDAERETARSESAREEHEAWSREQARRGNSSATRENAGVWLKQLPDEIGRT